jgi:hypothetical protein
MCFEADQRKSSVLNRDLNTFLYTIPHGKEILPQFKVSTKNYLYLQRQFFIHPSVLTSGRTIASLVPAGVNVHSVVVRATIPRSTPQDRTTQYITDQKDYAQAETGGISRQPLPQGPAPFIKNEFEFLTGLDEEIIDLTLSDSEGFIEPTYGFLVEVYLSGTDGSLTRMYEEDVVDFANDVSLSDGFSKYFSLVTDVKK